MVCTGNTGSKSLSLPEIAAIVDRQGGPPSGTSAAEWVSLARHESGGRYECVNEVGATGLWQIKPNVWGPVIRPDLGTPQFRAWLQKPDNNWQAARMIYATHRWAPWSGSHTPSAADRAAVSSPDQAGASKAGGVTPGLDLTPDIPVVSDTIKGVVDGFKAVVEFGNRIGKWISEPGNWLRVVQVIAGTALLIGGFLIVARPAVEDVGGSVAKALV